MNIVILWSVQLWGKKRGIFDTLLNLYDYKKLCTPVVS